MEETVNKAKYSWNTDTKTNPVTGAQATTVTRFSEDIDGAITFRCYEMQGKHLDVLISFPESVDWSRNTYSATGYSAILAFRLDKGNIYKLSTTKSSQKIGSIDFLYESESYTAFKEIAKSTLFEASIADGTIYEQTISIDVSGIQAALKPVLTLCGKEAL